MHSSTADGVKIDAALPSTPRHSSFLALCVSLSASSSASHAARDGPSHDAPRYGLASSACVSRSGASGSAIWIGDERLATASAAPPSVSRSVSSLSGVRGARRDGW